MALKVGDKKRKQVELVATGREFKNKEDGTVKRYNQYAVIINGIPIVVQVSLQDNTGRFILEEFFDKA